jgi:hypothetical protein
MPKTRTSGQGRPKGAPNKNTASIKEMVLGALSDVGGRDYLAARALDQPVAFMGLIGRVLPLQVTGENGGALVVDFRWADAQPQLERPAIDTDEPMSLSFIINEC